MGCLGASKPGIPSLQIYGGVERDSVAVGLFTSAACRVEILLRSFGRVSLRMGLGNLWLTHTRTSHHNNLLQS
jgi:hypothetical protein